MAYQPYCKKQVKNRAQAVLKAKEIKWQENEQ